MENLGVRFIPTDSTTRQGKTVWSGNKPALCFKGTKKAHCVIIGELEITTVGLPIDVVERSPGVADPMGQAAGVPYPPQRFVDAVMKTGKPLTPEARELLQEINGKKQPLPPNRPSAKLVTRPEKAGQLKTAGADLIIRLAQEAKLPTPKFRRFLRSQGLKAPYTDESVIRKAMKKLKEKK